MQNDAAALPLHLADGFTPSTTQCTDHGVTSNGMKPPSTGVPPPAIIWRLHATPPHRAQVRQDFAFR